MKHFYTILNFIQNILMIILLTHRLIKTQQYELKFQQIQQEVFAYKKQIDIMKFSQKSFSTVKHDFINHSIMLQGLIKENDTDGALKYLNKVFKYVYLPTIIETGRTDIDSILNFKIFIAKQYNIRIEDKIAIPIELDIKDYDIVIILGNLMDNAIEAVKNLSYKDRIIKIMIRYDRLCLIIQTKNKFNGDYEIGKSGNLLTTKPNPKENHGIGISNIKKVIANYNGVFTYKIDENGFFKTYILLYVNELHMAD